MKIGVTGATGQLGRIVVEKLKERVSAESIVALVRTPEKALDLGVKARAFDYSKPESLAESLQGIDSLLLISGNELGQRAQQHGLSCFTDLYKSRTMAVMLSRRQVSNDFPLPYLRKVSLSGKSFG